MTRASLGVCAGGVVLLYVVGCSTQGQFSLHNPQNGAHTDAVFSVVGGQPQVVAQSTNGWLQQAGFSTVVNESGKDVRIACAAPSGNRFAMVFTQQRGDATRVHIEWDGAPDWQTAAQLFAQLEMHSNRVIASAVGQAQARLNQAQAKLAQGQAKLAQVQQQLEQAQQTLNQGGEVTVGYQAPR